MSDILLNAKLSIDPSQIATGSLFVAGLVLLAIWLEKGGAASLIKSRIRQNRISYYTPFLLVFVWIVAVALVSGLLKRFYGGENADDSEFTGYVAFVVVEIVMIILFIFLAGQDFARGLRGFGLDGRTVFRDIGAAVINYIAVFPLVFLGIFVVVWIGQMVKGEDFLMQQNEGIGMLTESSAFRQCFLVIAFVIIVPIFEEMLFRGLLQSVLRQYVTSAWIAIIGASVLFTMLHPWMHWPALFFLSCCMGYTYEKSGSLIRAILVHAIFNAANVAGALLSSPAG